MNPQVWGPHFWFILHLVSFNYPDTPSNADKENYKLFYDSIGNILPCPNCRKHYKNYLSRYPIYPNLDNRMDLIQWVIQIHNFVNIKLNKRVLTTNEVLMIYASLDPVSPFINSNEDIIKKKHKQIIYGRLYAFIALFGIIAGFLIYYQRKHYFYFI